ncbi:MAG: hypothetical protein HRU70_11755 [Phycisphaeraceae bacterium]|nr:MAG: hypothetical protein HRU70_11755 [Phycisphaeraceae bacterium]
MVNAVIRWCMTNTSLMTLIILGICAAGYWAILRLPVDAIPDIPSVGGMAVSLITRFVVPCASCAVEAWTWKRHVRTKAIR